MARKKISAKLAAVSEPVSGRARRWLLEIWAVAGLVVGALMVAWAIDLHARVSWVLEATERETIAQGCIHLTWVEFSTLGEKPTTEAMLACMRRQGKWYAAAEAAHRMLSDAAK